MLNSSIIDFDIYIFTETWLNNNVYSSELFDPNLYTVFRCDRREAFRGSGGGVLIACNSKISSQSNSVVDLIDGFSQIDIVSVTIGKNPSICIIALYIPPDLSLPIYSDFLDALSTHRTTEAVELVVLGDFNSPYYLTYINDGYVCAKAELIHFFASFLNLMQYNNILNSLNRLLDLVFGSVECVTDHVKEPLVKLDPHHPALSISILTIFDRNKDIPKIPINKFNFHKYDKELLLNTLSTVNWDQLDNLPPNDACSVFYQLVESALEKALPKTRTDIQRNGNKYPLWFSSDIISDCKLKEVIRLKLIKNPSSYFRAQYNSLRSSLKSRIKSAYKAYQREAEDNLSKNPKNFWKFISNSKRKKQYPTSFYINNDNCSDPQIIANEFAKYFSNVYSPFDDSVDLSCFNANSDYLGGILLPDEDTIALYFKRLPNKMSTGMDGIPCSIVKDMASCLIKPITQLIKCSIRFGIFPTVWKEAKVCPIHKADDPSLVINYRPISLLCAFAKIFEMYIYDQLLPYVNVAITDAQHGFFCRRSTVTNLVTYTEYINHNINRGDQVDVVQTDFAKAFDKVDTVLLICRLRDLGIPSYLLSLLISYLTNRCNYVIFNGFSSRPFKATSGVPQGSNLGPLLFLIFINSLTNVVSCPIELFADDAKFYLRIHSWSDCVILQENLDSLASWCQLNKLQLNERKCTVMSYRKSQALFQFPYSINNVTLMYVSSCRDLGVIFDNRLTFKNHLANITASAFKTLGFVVRTTKNFKNINAIKILYFALVRTKLEYASIVWSPIYKKQILEIEKVQRKFIKYLLFKISGEYPARGTDYLDLCERVKMLTLEERRTCAEVLFTIGVCRGQIHCPNFLALLPFYIPPRNLRSSQPFRLPLVKSALAQASPLYRLITSCNSISAYNHDNHSSLDLLGYNQPITANTIASILISMRNT